LYYATSGEAAAVSWDDWRSPVSPGQGEDDMDHPHAKSDTPDAPIDDEAFWKKQGAKYKYLVFADRSFIVFLDNDLTVDWMTTPEYDRIGRKDPYLSIGVELCPPIGVQY
jgi:hypothetical protein